jgi:hypothetical protein
MSKCCFNVENLQAYVLVVEGVVLQWIEGEINIFEFRYDVTWVEYLSRWSYKVI